MNYEPMNLSQLLEQVGLLSQVALMLLMVETLLAVALEPIMGGLSDRAPHWMGTRFPFISSALSSCRLC
ncbi:MAG: hypothetical protein HC865_23650 [Cyanobacteria bacterium RU_5_0]|nr:hypothetical protein [Cyanobacteria bacterium RU_5_0]